MSQPIPFPTDMLQPRGPGGGGGEPGGSHWPGASFVETVGFMPVCAPLLGLFAKTGLLPRAECELKQERESKYLLAVSHRQRRCAHLCRPSVWRSATFWTDGWGALVCLLLRRPQGPKKSRETAGCGTVKPRRQEPRAIDSADVKAPTAARVGAQNPSSEHPKLCQWELGGCVRAWRRLVCRCKIPGARRVMLCTVVTRRSRCRLLAWPENTVNSSTVYSWSTVRSTRCRRRTSDSWSI